MFDEPVKMTIHPVFAPQQLTPLVRTLVAATADTGLGRWLVPVRDERLAVLERFFAAVVAFTLRQGGQVFELDDGAGLVVWQPFSIRVGRRRTRGGSAGRGSAVLIPEPTSYEALTDAVCGVHSNRFRHLVTVIGQVRPRSRHDGLLIAVSPAQRHSGFVDRLMEYTVSTFDDVTQPVLLVATDPEQWEVYLRYGFRPASGGPVGLPEGGPMLWPMLRHPNP